MNRIDLNGRRAIITGGAKGLGAGIAKRLMISGARVSIWDIGTADLAATAKDLSVHGDVDMRVVDVSDEGQVEAATEEAVAAMGGLDILVNNAGIGGPNKQITEISLAEWRQVYDVNATGTFLCCRAAVPHLERNGYGRIVNISSANAKEGKPKTIPYSAAKSAVMTMTKSLAKELASSNILVNCVAPATITTDFLQSRSQEHLETVKARIPIGRFAEVGEAAAMVAWLCSEELSYSTGAAFDLSGGRLIY